MRPPAGDVGGEFGFGGGAYGEAGAVVEEEIEGEDVVDGFAAHEGVDAAGVVADHAADGAAGVGGGVGGEGEGEFFCGVADAVENDAGLDVDGFLLGSIASMPFMYFEKSRMTAALQPWPAREVPAPRERRGALTARQAADGGDDVGFVAGDDDADGDVAVVGAVGGVEGFGGGVEADFAADGGAELLLEGVGLGEGVVYASVGARQKDERGGGHSAHYTAGARVIAERDREGLTQICADDTRF